MVFAAAMQAASLAKGRVRLTEDVGVTRIRIIIHGAIWHLWLRRGKWQRGLRGRERHGDDCREVPVFMFPIFDAGDQAGDFRY
jgi:hypothetical protein